MLLPKNELVSYRNSFLRLPISIEEKLEQNNFYLYSQNTHDDILRSFCKIKSWKIQCFSTEIARSTLLLEIQNIYFPNLQELRLSESKIASIQKIARISIPNLQSLTFRNSKITNIFCLRKSNFKHLKKIQIQNQIKGLNKSLIAEYKGFDQVQVNSVVEQLHFSTPFGITWLAKMKFQLQKLSKLKKNIKKPFLSKKWISLTVVEEGDEFYPMIEEVD